MKQLLSRRLACILTGLLCCCMHTRAQEFFLVDSYANIYRSTAGTTCSSTRLVASCITNVGDIAYYKDTLYFISYTDLYRIIVSKPGAGCTFVARFNTFVNSLTVDSLGTVYAAGGSDIYSYAPGTGKTTFHGTLPRRYSAGGDLTFFNGKLYLAAIVDYNFNSSYLVEVNISHPDQSFTYVTLKSKNVYGCITLSKMCGMNGLFITGQDEYSAFLTEIDMVNKTELDVRCKYDFSIYGAASSTEGGTSSKPHIDSMALKTACADEAPNGAITVSTRATGYLLTYTLNGSVSNKTGIFTGLKPGTYHISISGEPGCMVDTTVTLPKADVSSFTVQAMPPTCAGNNGRIAVQSPDPGLNIRYSLNNGGFAGIDTFNNLAAGTYVIKAMNGNGCIGEKTVTLTRPELDTVGLRIQMDNASCSGDNGSIRLFVPRATRPVVFSLNDTLRSASGTFQHLAASGYALSVTDANGCRMDTTVMLTAQAAATPVTGVTTVPASCPYTADGSISLSVTGPEGPYTVSVNSGPFTSRYSYPGLVQGSYRFNIRNREGCQADAFTTQLAARPGASCNTVYFPNAFTPGKAGRNDRFKPVVSGVPQQYTLAIYNRAGQKVFETNDPSTGWDGTIQGKLQGTSAFVWYCRYRFPGAGQHEKLEKGTVMLIR